MRKGFAALLFAGAVFSLSACGGQDAQTTTAAQTEAATEAVKLDPKEVYSEAMKKNAELKSMDVTLGMAMDMTFGEESLNMNMEMDMKADGYETDDIKYLMTSTTSADGEEIEMTMFYTDGYFYMDALGQKMKYAMSAEDISEQAGASTSGMEVDVDWLSDIALTEQGEDKLITFVGDPELMASYVEELLASSGTGMDGMEMTVKSVTGECLVGPDGYFKTENLVMEIEFAVEEETAAMEMDMSLTYNNPGEPVTIELPSTDGFTEIDASMLQQ